MKPGREFTVFQGYDTEEYDRTITLHEEIGSGTYGVVFRGTLNENPHEEQSTTYNVAVKFVMNIPSTHAFRTIIEMAAKTSLLQHSVTARMIIVNDGPSLYTDIVDTTPIMYRFNLYGVFRHPLLQAIEVYDYVAGPTLDKVAILEDEHIYNLLAGLVEFKTHGLVHRDIKPQNLILDLDTNAVRYIDFGLVCHVTMCNGMSGTVPYMPPEVLRNDIDVDWQQVDVYSVGCVLFEICSGRAKSIYRYMRELALVASYPESDDAFTQWLTDTNDFDKLILPHVLTSLLRRTRHIELICGMLRTRNRFTPEQALEVFQSQF